MFAPSLKKLNKMKKIFLSVFALASLAVVSCGGGAETEVTETPVADTTVYVADAAASMVNWRGEVAGVYGHEGNINLQSGEVMVSDSQVIGGQFVIDMKTIQPTDSASYNEENSMADLVAHLAQADFFATDSFPTAMFVIKSINGNTATGDLTVRGITNEETLNIETMNITDTDVNMAGTLVFNRQKYNVKWVHYMKDMVLSDDIAIKFNVTAKK
jgi:polyisoprenoid-binding protein YceI